MNVIISYYRTAVQNNWKKWLKIVYLTTISLYSDILKKVGIKPLDRKKNGKTKMYTIDINQGRYTMLNKVCISSNIRSCFLKDNVFLFKIAIHNLPKSNRHQNQLKVQLNHQ